MKGEKRFFAVALCALSSLLFVLCANMLAAQFGVTEAGTGECRIVADAEHEDEGGESNKDANVEEYYRDKQQEGEGEVTGEEYERAPSDSEEQPATQWPSDEENFPVNPGGDDDIASLSVTRCKAKSLMKMNQTSMS